MTALERISNRTRGDKQKQAARTVEKILEDIKDHGDKSLSHYTLQFDGFDPDPLAVTNEEIDQAWKLTPQPLQEALSIAKSRIESFHKSQVPKNILLKGKFGEKLGRRWKPVQRAGIYVPGGRASYPSTVLMNAIPAYVAGVDEIIMCSPAHSDGIINKTVLAAASLVGIKKVFRVGGSQAIGAMAYGTETIPKVNVISGPGNLYVTLAKKYVYGEVGIDALAGPSEVLIIADGSADIDFIAADLLAQAEHDPLAATILLTTDKRLSDNIDQAILDQLNQHPRAEICLTALKEWGLKVLCNDIETCINLSNYFAPEHLELLIEKPYQYENKIINAGAIFLGPLSPEAVGDYIAGPNHTLPTSGTAKFSGALSVETFMKNTSIIEFNQSAFENNRQAIIELANSEGLYSHANSIRIRSSKSFEEK
ncbi:MULTISPECIES: histidinol dehydrogenase [Prochlorococcus]|uniref:histidinol dehydrogenase n=1 Tax=Prochlorococcus TaxID=1218 RepID=UPI000689617B|nr:MULTISPECIES: histidinol dehydrogenase [Prochlorococcus]